MTRAALLIALLPLLACQKAPEPAPVPPPAAEAAAPVEEPDDAHPADQIAAQAAPAVAVTPDVVERYLAYRRLVVERGKVAVAEFRKESPPPDPSRPIPLAVRTARAAEGFAVRMRAIEESARKDAKLSRDEVAAVGQVAAEVFAARQIWRISGGDAAVEKARAQAASAKGADRASAERAYAEQEKGFRVMKEARSARERFGDAAVDAVLAREDALWKIQQDGARVMSEVY